MCCQSYTTQVLHFAFLFLSAFFSDGYYWSCVVLEKTLSNSMGNTVRAKLFKIREKKKAKQHSRWIDRQIQSDLTKKKSEIKCLVSGIYGSGKTTLIHHMDLIYNPNLLNEEILECRKRIYMEVFRSLIAIIQEMKKDQCLKLKFLSYSYLLDNLLWHANLSNNGCKLPSEISNALKRLWSDVDIKIWYKQHKDRLDSCHHFFLKRLMEILNDNYTPVEQDILHAGNTTKNNLNEVKCQLDTAIDAINGSKHHASQTIKSTKQDHAIEFMIDEVINTAMKTQKIPGVALGVFRRGEIIFSKVYGYSNLEHEVPVKLETMFQSGSVGKQFTSMAIMMLVEHEKLQLDDKIQKYFHDAPIEWANITIRNLLTHTSGMVSYSPDLNFQQAYTEDDVYNIIKSTTLIYQPGQQFSYSNFGYIMLGFLIQRVTNQSYANFIHEHIFRPLGMKTARIINETSIIPNRASGYVFIDDHIINQPWVSPIFNTMADGSFYFNIYDMVKWDEALYSDVLLKRQASFDEMWSPVKLNGNITYEYGFGWSLLEAINGMRIIEHGGSWQGFRTMIVRVPEDERTVFLFTNMNRPTVDVRKIAHDVLHIYNAQLAVKPTFDYQSQ
ncbi:unnamed protein product [Rotaria socialis]